MTCARREVSFVRSGYFLIHQRTLQKDSRKNHNLFVFFCFFCYSEVYVILQTIWLQWVWGILVDIIISIQITLLFFFDDGGGRVVLLQGALGKKCDPTHSHNTPLHTHTLLPPSSFRSTTRPPPTFPPPPPHPPPYHLQGGLISIRIDPGLPFPVTDIYKTIGQCARVCQLHFLFFSVRQCVFVSRQVTARLSRIPETCTPSEQLYQRNNRCTTPTTPHGHVKRSAETAPKRASVFASLKNTNKDVHTHHPFHLPLLPPPLSSSPPPSLLLLLPPPSLSTPIKYEVRTVIRA